MPVSLALDGWKQLKELNNEIVHLRLRFLECLKSFTTELWLYDYVNKSNNSQDPVDKCLNYVRLNLPLPTASQHNSYFYTSTGSGQLRLLCDVQIVHNFPLWLHVSFPPTMNPVLYMFILALRIFSEFPKNT